MNEILSGVPILLRRVRCNRVEKGVAMVYDTPAVEVIGKASEHIQAFVGPRYDGDGISLSQMCFDGHLEEE